MTDSQKCKNEAKSTGSCSHQVEIVNLADRPPVPIPEPIASLPWTIGVIETPVGKIPVVRTRLQPADILGSWKARWGIRRMSYRIQPGLYAVGNPTDASPVFVTANYKMSFDRLRSQLEGIDGWILVLDTKGINVWCAAGKGTFGTTELIKRIEATGLRQIVSHRRLIVPQLGATGISAHLVRQDSGFHVFYGPIRAKDLREFMKAGMKATPEMRRVTFTLSERAVLVPVDIVGNLKYAFFIAACLLLLSGLGADLYSLGRVAQYGLANAALVLLAALCGATLPALLLPCLPGRAFSVKGACAGILPMVGLVIIWQAYPALLRNWLSLVSWLLFIPAVTSFIGMNFTGSSTYTSLSGVKKEMRHAIPVQIGLAVCGLAFWITGVFV
jgi:hypothetical protein